MNIGLRNDELNFLLLHREISYGTYGKFRIGDYTMLVTRWKTRRCIISVVFCRRRQEQFHSVSERSFEALARFVAPGEPNMIGKDSAEDSAMDPAYCLTVRARRDLVSVAIINV